MLLGGTDPGPARGSLRLRKNRGVVRVEGEAPRRHLFPRKFIERELNDAVSIHIEVKSKPPLIYEVRNLVGTDLEADLISEAPEPTPETPTPRRDPLRWLRRKTNG